MKMEKTKSKATLAESFPSVFSQVPENIKYTERTENYPDNTNFDEIEEKINEIDLSLQLSPNKKKNTKSKSSLHSFSARSSQSSKTQNSELTTSSLFQTTGSISNMNINPPNPNPSPIKIKITHFIKRKKKKNVKKNRKRSPMRNYLKNLSPPKVQQVQPCEQKHVIKKHLLPFSVLYPGYHIRFNYHPQDIVCSKESLGCPTILTYRNGDTETKFKDGTSQILHSRNKFTYFSNGDIQHEFPDGAIAYYYASNKATEFIHPNGIKVLQFIDGQRYTYYPNVKIEITKHLINPRFDQFET